MSKHLRLNRRALTKRHLLGSKLSKPELKNETGRCLASLLAHLAAAPAIAAAVVVVAVVVDASALQCKKEEKIEIICLQTRLRKEISKFVHWLIGCRGHI